MAGARDDLVETDTERNDRGSAGHDPRGLGQAISACLPVDEPHEAHTVRPDLGDGRRDLGEHAFEVENTRDGSKHGGKVAVPAVTCPGL